MARLPGTPQQQPTPHSRYTKFWTGRSPMYKRVALLLQTIQYTELLCEMAAKRRGERTRWRVVTLLESIKAILRFLLLRLTDSRPLVSPPMPEREVDPSTLEEESKHDREEPVVDLSAPSDGADISKPQWTMPRTGLPLPALPSSGDISQVCSIVISDRTRYRTECPPLVYQVLDGQSTKNQELCTRYPYHRGS